MRVALFCALLVLLVSSLSQVEAKKKSTKEALKEAANEAAAGYNAATAAAAQPKATPVTTNTVSKTSKPSAPAPSAAEVAEARESALKALKRKRTLLEKKREKAASARAVSQKAAQARAVQLAQRRAAKAARIAKAKASAKSRADALVAKKRAADTPDIRARGHEKLKQLLRRSGESGTRIINFDTKSYHAFLSEGPRPYHLFVSYTALTSAHSCMYCHLAHDALIPVAQAHYERSKSATAMVLSSNSTADIDESDLPVFFANVDMARCADLYKELKFTQAPYLILAPPRLGTKPVKPTEFIRTLPQKYRFNLQATMTPNDFAGFIHKLAGSHVHIEAAKPGFTDLVFSLVVLSAIAFVGVKYGSDIILHLREVRGIRFLVLLLGCVVYCWCISGGMYNVLKGTQFAETRQDGSINYINGDARDQFAAEGLIIGVLNLAAAAAVIVLNSRSFDDPVASPPKGAKLSPAQHLKNAIAPFFTASVCLALMAALWFQVIDIYTRSDPHTRTHTHLAEAIACRAHHG